MDQENNERIREEVRAMLAAIAASDEAPHSQRAAALLSMDSGSSFSEAVAASGLRENQVRYWLGRYRNAGLAVFPDDIVETVKAKNKAEDQMEADSEEGPASGKSEPATKEERAIEEQGAATKKVKKPAKKKAKTDKNRAAKNGKGKRNKKKGGKKNKSKQKGKKNAGKMKKGKKGGKKR